MKIPYDLESLKTHFESHHPKHMKTFHQGWKSIGKPIQEWWLSQARKGLANQIDKNRRPNHFNPPTFFSWHGVLCSAFDTMYSRRETCVHRDYTENIRRSLEKAIEASAIPLFNIPETPDQKNYSGSHETAWSVRWTFSRYFAKKIVEQEMGKLVKWLDIRLAEDGLENVFKKYVPQFTWLEEENFEASMAETDEQ